MTMNTNRKDRPVETDGLTVRRPYEKPNIQRVDLALAETLSEGCKLETNFQCMGPPVKAYEGGS